MLCHDVVRYVGDAVAIVAAESEDIAAKHFIDVEYAPLPVVADPVYAFIRRKAPILHQIILQEICSNILKKVRHGDIDGGFAEADVIEREYRTPLSNMLSWNRNVQSVFRREWRREKLTVYVGSQIPLSGRNQIALKEMGREEQVSVIGTLIGGRFLAAKRYCRADSCSDAGTVTGHPVKMLYTRQGQKHLPPQTPCNHYPHQNGREKDGRLTAVQATSFMVTVGCVCVPVG